MIHGRHRGVSLNFQAKTPTARMPNIVPMILGSITFHFHSTFFISDAGIFGTNFTLPPSTAPTQSTPDHDLIHTPTDISVCESMHQ
jgi:hypothetical protein